MELFILPEGLLSHKFQLVFLLWAPLNSLVLNFFCLVLKPTSKTTDIGQFLNLSYSTTMKYKKHN